MVIHPLIDFNVNFHNEYLQNKFQIFKGDLFKINALFDRIKDCYDSSNKKLKEIPYYISEINFVLIFIEADLELQKENPNFKTEEESQELQKYLGVISQIQGIVKIKIFKQEKLVLSIDKINANITYLKEGIKKSERLSKKIEKRLKDNSDRVNRFVSLQNQLRVQLQQDQSIKKDIEEIEKKFLQNQRKVQNKFDEMNNKENTGDLTETKKILEENNRMLDCIKKLGNFQEPLKKNIQDLGIRLFELEQIKPLTEEEIREFFGRINLLHASVLSRKQALDDKIKIKRQILKDMLEKLDLYLNFEPIDEAYQPTTATSPYKFRTSYLEIGRGDYKIPPRSK